MLVKHVYANLWNGVCIGGNISYIVVSFGYLLKTELDCCLLGI